MKNQILLKKNEEHRITAGHQWVFSNEIASLLENYGRYARLMIESHKDPATKPPTPIWYHCPCGGKADVEMTQASDCTLSAKCRACNTTSEFKGGLRAALQQMLPNLSLRAEAMLLAFSGIGLTFYVGGHGGAEYLGRAYKIAESLSMRFPVVSIWRPRDIYGGVGQLDAILELLRMRLAYDLVRNAEKCDAATVLSELDDRLAEIDSALYRLDDLKRAVATRKLDGFKEKIASVVNMQNELKTRFERDNIARDRSIVANTKTTARMIPSIIDYVINIGMRSTARQWSKALENELSFNADVPLKTNAPMDTLFRAAMQFCSDDLFR